MVARTAVKSAATKATRTSKVQKVDEPDLLADMDTSPVVEEEEDDFDLLSDMSESNATAWVPWNDEDQSNAIQGKVIHIGTVTQDAKYGGEEIPYVEIQDKSDPELVWGVRGYSTVLENQLQREIDNDLRSGDYLAVVYKGVQSNRKGDNEYKNFVVKSKHIGH